MNLDAPKESGEIKSVWRKIQIFETQIMDIGCGLITTLFSLSQLSHFSTLFLIYFQHFPKGVKG